MLRNILIKNLKGLFFYIIFETEDTHHQKKTKADLDGAKLPQRVERANAKWEGFSKVLLVWTNK